MKKLICQRALLCLIACFSLLTGCDRQSNDTDYHATLPSQKSASSGSKHVAVMFPKNTQIGKSLVDAAQLALMKSPNPQTHLHFYDTGTSVEGAQKAAHMALKDGCTLSVGPLYRTQTKAIAPITHGKIQSILSLSNDQTLAGMGIYVTGQDHHQSMGQLVAYAAAQSKQKFGILSTNTPYSRLITKAFKQAVQSQGLHITRHTTYTQDYASMQKSVKNFLDTTRKKDEAYLELENLDAILIADSNKRSAMIAALLAFEGVNLNQIRLLGTPHWRPENLHQEPALHGAWFPATQYNRFKQDFITTFGYKPPRIAGLAFDAVAVLSQVSAGSTHQSALTNPAGFWGVTGLFRFKPNGYVERSYPIAAITKTAQIRVLKPVGRHFND
jgi:branched-chain amino acid transport system substrate-binding protein